MALSIKLRLAAAFAFLAFLSAGQGVVSISKALGTESDLTGFKSRVLPAIVAINEIQDATSEVRIKQYRLLARTVRTRPPSTRANTIKRVPTSCVPSTPIARLTKASAVQTAQRSATVAAAARETAGSASSVADAARELGQSVRSIYTEVEGSSSLADVAAGEAHETERLIDDLVAGAAGSAVHRVLDMASDLAGQSELLRAEVDRFLAEVRAA